jgi:hypothetical protein
VSQGFERDTPRHQHFSKTIGIGSKREFEPEGFMTPVNMMFVDLRGEATRIVIGPSGEPEYYH